MNQSTVMNVIGGFIFVLVNVWFWIGLTA